MRKKVSISVIFSLIVAIIVTVSGFYYFEGPPSSPFHNTVWHDSNLGNITSVVHSNTTLFFSNFTVKSSSSGNGTLSIGITAVNISHGNRLWSSKGISVSVNSPLIITSNLDAPKMLIYGGFLYVIVYNAIDALEIKNFDLYVFNTTSGIEANHYTIDYGWMQDNVSNLYAPSVIETPGYMYLSFITEFIPFTGPNGPINATFHTIKYSIGQDALTKLDVANHSVPGSIEWGLDSMSHRLVSGQEVFSFVYDNNTGVVNFTLLEDLSSGKIIFINTYINQLSSTSNGVYYSNLRNKTITVYSINLINGNITELFNFTNQNLGNNSNTMYTMYPLTNDRFTFVIQGDLIGLLTSQYPDVTYVCYSSNGSLVWNNSVKANNYGDFSQVTIIGNNEVMFSTETAAYTHGATYVAHFIIKNIKSGSTTWRNSYGYKFQNSNGILDIFAHDFYGGILTATNGYVIFNQGNGITCSELPNS